MASSPVVKVGLTFADRDSNRAVMTCYCAFAISIPDAYTFALAMASRASALSDAVLVEFDLAWRWTIDDPGDPGIDSTVQRKILMLITNDDDEINGMMIPSPANNWEATGNYAGIRLDLASAAAIQFGAMLLAVDFRTDDNRQLGTILAAGGLAL